MSHRVEARITEDLQALDEIIAEESERSFVLSVACFLEDRLRELLTRHAGEPDPREMKVPKANRSVRKGKKPKDPGPPKFQDLVAEARARKLLSRDVLFDIDRIREIRNVFGHSFAVRRLAHTPRVATLCDQLRLPDKPGEQPAASIWVRARHRFDISALRTIRAIVDVIFEEERQYRDGMRERREREAAVNLAGHG